MIDVLVMEEAGHRTALYGMSLSHGLHEMDLDVDKLWARMLARANNLAHKQGGHNKFLESIMLWISVRAPRYWWQQADTYRIASKQSESTMHTILKRGLGQEDFYEHIPHFMLNKLNSLIADKDLDRVKRLLPESFMQRRVWCLSYKTLQNIYRQRHDHKLQEWQDFLNGVLEQIAHPEYIKPEEEK